MKRRASRGKRLAVSEIYAYTGIDREPFRIFWQVFDADTLHHVNIAYGVLVPWRDTRLLNLYAEGQHSPAALPFSGVRSIRATRSIFNMREHTILRMVSRLGWNVDPIRRAVHDGNRPDNMNSYHRLLHTSSSMDVTMHRPSKRSGGNNPAFELRVMNATFIIEMAKPWTSEESAAYALKYAQTAPHDFFRTMSAVCEDSGRSFARFSFDTGAYSAWAKATKLRRIVHGCRAVLRIVASGCPVRAPGAGGGACPVAHPESALTLANMWQRFGQHLGAADGNARRSIMLHVEQRHEDVYATRSVVPLVGHSRDEAARLRPLCLLRGGPPAPHNWRSQPVQGQGEFVRHFG